MALYFKKLSLYKFRNHLDEAIYLNEAITILYGPNASGKTNTVEALQLLTAGMSFRKPSPNELININSDMSRIGGILEGDGRILETQLDITSNKKIFSKNGKKCASYEMAQFLPSILFCPDDLTFIKGSSTQRRKDLDSFASQVSPGYGELLRAYTKAIEQRNRLLKDQYVDVNLLSAWDEYIAAHGAALVIARRNLIARLALKTSEIYRDISGGEALVCSYMPNGIESCHNSSKEEISQLLLEQLQCNRSDDMRLRHTTVGPHRDDIRFDVSDMDSKLYCSQGQQRSIVLAWKMAQVFVCEDILDQKPLLLLDDVMSELDEGRRSAILQFIQDDIQTVITTTNLSYFNEEILNTAKVIKYGTNI